MSKSNIETFLKLIKEDATPVVSVHVPSLGSYIDFTPITVQQQKLIIKDTLSGVSGNINLQKTLNDIILSNQVDQSIELNILDRSAILVQLRVAYLGDLVAINGDVLSKLCLNRVDLSDFEKTTTIEDNGISVDLSIPNLKKDSNFIYLLGAEKTFTNPGDLVNDLYTSEVAKFISKVTFKDIEVVPALQESLTIVNALPTSLISKIMTYIKKVKESDGEALRTTDGKSVMLGTNFFNDPI